MFNHIKWLRSLHQLICYWCIVTNRNIQQQHRFQSHLKRLCEKSFEQKPIMHYLIQNERKKTISYTHREYVKWFVSAALTFYIIVSIHFDNCNSTNNELRSSGAEREQQQREKNKTREIPTENHQLQYANHLVFGVETKQLAVQWEHKTQVHEPAIVNWKKMDVRIGWNHHSWLSLKYGACSMQKQNLNTFGCFWRNRLEMLEAEATTNYYYYYNAIELIAQLNCIRSFIWSHETYVFVVNCRSGVFQFDLIITPLSVSGLPNDETLSWETEIEREREWDLLTSWHANRQFWWVSNITSQLIMHDWKYEINICWTASAITVMHSSN